VIGPYNGGMQERILIVDDDPEIRRLISAYLEQAAFQVAVVADGIAALEQIRRQRPDLVVLDLMLPKADGFEVTRRMRSDPAMAGIPVIMLTARLEDTDKVLGLELGADDYLTKPFNPRELVARVRAVLRRTTGAAGGAGAPGEARVLVSGGLRLDQERRQVTVDGREIGLTKTEYSLLEILMANQGYTLTRDDLLERALGYSWEGMGRTLDTHIRNLRRKIEADPEQPRYVVTVHGIGYRLKPTEGAQP
jgi:DNA-binding response OmpR family regulator